MKNMKKILATGALAAVMALGVAAPAITASAVELKDYTVGQVIEKGTIIDNENKLSALVCADCGVLYMAAGSVLNVYTNWVQEGGAHYEHKQAVEALGYGQFDELQQYINEKPYTVVDESGKIPSAPAPAPNCSIVSIVKKVAFGIVAAFTAVLTALYWIGKIGG